MQRMLGVFIFLSGLSLFSEEKKRDPAFIPVQEKTVDLFEDEVSSL